MLMSRLPPQTDPHRVMLERDFGVEFVRLVSSEAYHAKFEQHLRNDLTRALRDLKPTVISNLNGRGIGFCYASAMAANALGLYYVWRIGGNDLESRGEKAERLLKPYWGTQHYFDSLVQERLTAHLADRIIVMSQRERLRLASMTIGCENLHVCVRGVDQNYFRPPDDRAFESCKRFLFIGRRSLEKGYDILENAMEQLADSHADLTATFAGTFESKELGNRRYVGFVEYADLPALYNSHDALIVCSRSEGFPQVIMEAMSCGLPCILTRSLFENEFGDDEGCLMIDPSPEALAAVMARLAGDGKLYQRLVRQSLAVAKQRFSMDANRPRYHDILLTD